MANERTPQQAGVSHMIDTTNEHRAIQVLDQLGTRYAEAGIAESEIVLGSGHAVHGLYFSARDPTLVIHVQAHPGMSSNQEVYITARLRDYDRMIEQRRKGIVQPGSEHASALKDGFGEQLGLGISIPYDAAVLEERLREACTIPRLLEQKAGGE